MTRKHFQLIAQTIKTLQFPERLMSPEAMREEVAKAFASALRSTNAQFDVERFVAACTEGL